MLKNAFLSLALVAVLAAIGCSGGVDNPIAMDNSASAMPNISHQLWGIWQFTADREKGTLDIVPLRLGEFHLNALPFLEPPPFVKLSLESLEFNGDMIDADIGLRHPFLGLNEFTGFDVCGILITNGDVTGFGDADIRMAGEGDTRLLNADGNSRWWNPAEFPAGTTMFNYKDGLLGTPDSIMHYNSTVNGYKYFCDDLTDPNSPLSEVTLERRGLFGAGSKNVRHYTIQLGTEGLIFNYAIDASWQFPDGSYPWEAPDDFGPGANRSEAWRVDVTELSNTLWNDGSENGGGLTLQVDAYDWFNADLNTIRVESPGNFTMVESAIAIGGGAGYSTYEVEIAGATPGQYFIDLLISAASEQEDFEGFITGVNITSYFTYTALVSDESPDDIFKNIPLRADVKPYDAAIDPIDGKILIIYDDEEVWKYLPSDNYQFPNPNQKYYDCEWHLLDPYPGNPFNVQHAYIEIADNQYVGVLFGWNPGVHVNRAWYDVLDESGNQVNRIVPIGIYFGISYVNKDMLAWGESAADASYHNRMGTIWGHSVPYYTFVSYSLESENYMADHYYATANMGWSPPPPYGKDIVYGPWVRGTEVDQDDHHFWALEASDYYCARFTNVTWDNAYFGTGVQTDDDDGFYNPRDLTRDSLNQYLVLDELSDLTHRIKAYDVSGSNSTTPAEFIGGLDLDDIIIGPAYRLDGSDWVHPSHGNAIVVLHGDDVEGYYMSIFFPDDFPW